MKDTITFIAKLLFRPDLLDKQDSRTDAAKISYLANGMETNELTVFMAAARYADKNIRPSQMEKLFQKYLRDQDEIPPYVRQYCRTVVDCIETGKIQEASRHLDFMRIEMGLPTEHEPVAKTRPANPWNGPDLPSGP